MNPDIAPAPAPAPSPNRPLAISLLIGVSGWAAGLFMLGFAALLLRPASAAAAGGSGAVLLVVAWALFKLDHDDERVFVTQLALALSIAGQCLLLFAASQGARGIAPIAQAALLLQLVLAFVMPNRLHRTLSTFFACIAWALTVRSVLVTDPWPFGSGDATLATPSLALALIAWFVTWIPVGGALTWAVRREAAETSKADLASRLTTGSTTGLVLGLAFATIASQPLETWAWRHHPDRGALALWPLLTALGALGAVAAAFARRQRGLMALCIVAALLHLSHFYYALGTSLVAKSLLMLVMGAIALLAARIVRPKDHASKEAA